MGWQEAIAGLIVLAAAIALWRRARSKKKKGACEKCSTD